MNIWLLIAGCVATTALIKGIGPVMLGGRELPPVFLGVIACMAPALLTALVVSSTFVTEQRLVLDARAAGLAAGVAALWLRLPVLVALVAAVAVTALLRAWA